MTTIITMLAEAFSINELTAILRRIAGDDSISDNTIRIYASALCLAWMDCDEIEKAIEELDNNTLVKKMLI